MPKRLSRLAAAALLLALSACGGGGLYTPAATPATPTPPTITLLAAAGMSVSGGKPVALTASVSSNDAVTWQLAAGAPGSLSGASGGAVNYVPPQGGIVQPTSVTVTASAGGASKSLTFTLYPDPGPAGLTPIAGDTGGRFVLDGTGTMARFRDITSMTAAPDGSILIADNGNLRKLSANGAVTTLLRPTTTQIDGGPANATPGYVLQVASAADGALYMLTTDSINGTPNFGQRVRKLAADGSISTDTRLTNLQALPADKDGTVYTVLSSRAIQKTTAAGVNSIVAGNPAGQESLVVDGKGSAARFVSIQDWKLAPDGSLAVLDNGLVRRIAPDGTVTSLALNLKHVVTNIAYDETGNLLVLSNTDLNQYVIATISPALTLLSEQPVTLQGFQSYNAPGLMLAAKGRVLLASGGAVLQPVGNRLEEVAGKNDSTVENVDGPAATARFAEPSYISALPDGALVVADALKVGLPLGSQGLVLRKVAANGDTSTLLTRADMSGTWGVLADKAGNIYFSEMRLRDMRLMSGGGIHKLAPNGTLTLLTGSRNFAADPAATLADGAPGTATFNMAILAGIDGNGNLYVRDHYANADVWRKVTPDGSVTTIASPPAGLNAAPDGYVYTLEGTDNPDKPALYRTAADGSRIEVADITYRDSRSALALPTNAGLTPIGPYTFALISGSAIVKLVLPH